MNMRAVKLKILAFVTFLIAMVVVACTGGRSEQPEGEQHVAVHDAASDPKLIVIKAKDYAFEAPDTAEAGLTTIRLINEGAEMHHIWMVRLQEGKTMSDFIAALQTSHVLPSWAVDVGGPNAPGGPGAHNDATLQLEPGNYVLVCVIPGPDGKPHVMKGMVRPLAVTGTGHADMVLPAADIVMTLDDYKFDTNKPITAGRHTIRIENAAAQSHEVIALQLAPGKTAHEMLAWIAKQQGPPPGKPVAGITGIARGEVNQITADFEPGNYMLVCFWPDAKDGKPHFVHGMLKEFTVS